LQYKSEDEANDVYYNRTGKMLPSNVGMNIRDDAILVPWQPSPITHLDTIPIAQGSYILLISL
jgi:hypothetical protein